MLETADLCLWQSLLSAASVTGSKRLSVAYPEHVGALAVLAAEMPSFVELNLSGFHTN